MTSVSAVANAMRLHFRTRKLRGRKCLVERVDPPEEPAELEATEDLLELGAVGRSQDEGVGVDVE